MKVTGDALVNVIAQVDHIVNLLLSQVSERGVIAITVILTNDKGEVESGGCAGWERKGLEAAGAAGDSVVDEAIVINGVRLKNAWRGYGKFNGVIGSRGEGR